MADDYYDLEINIRHYHSDDYLATIRFRNPDGQFDHEPVSDTVEIKLDDLLQQQLNVDDYGRLLTDSLFSSQGEQLLKNEFERARVATENAQRKMRIRLFIDSNAANLHSLRWELLRDPRDLDQRLLTNNLFLFSRFLAGPDYLNPRLHPKGDLRAMVVIANPVGLDAYQGLAPVPVQDELQRARDALGDMLAKELVSDPATQTRATLAAIVSALREGYDILYLVCHGRLSGAVPGAFLWLEKEEGGVHRLPGASLVSALRDLGELRPSVVILASCQSAGDGKSQDEGVLAALGPTLAREAAIPAIVAMQGDVLIDTVRVFMPEFFRELAGSGCVDAAMTAGRAAIVNHDDRHVRDDWWVPALFMRLRNGLIWYEPRFAADQQGFATWDDLINAIKINKCMPILGPDLLDFLMGSPQDIAMRWAEKDHFPMSPHNIRSLPQVARYTATVQSPVYPPTELTNWFRKELLERHEMDLPNPPPDLLLADLIKLVGEKIRRENEADPYRVLAKLPCEIYINTNPDDLLVHALREENKDPQIALCPWKKYIQQPDSAFERDPRYRPTVQQPLVYYLFGRLGHEFSQVISEDDYFEFLIWISQDQAKGDTAEIPKLVSRAWSGNALIFLGFQADDWAFRVVLHSIINPEMKDLPRPRSVAVQILPEEGKYLEPDLAADFLRQYLGDFKYRKSSIYWGSAQDFIRDLWAHRGNWLAQDGQND
jgi:hypothetical protein